MPMRMTKGRTIQRKGREKGKTVNNYRPVTCLPLVCKLLTGVIVKEGYGFLDTNLLLLHKQKGCRGKSRVANDLLFMIR